MIVVASLSVIRYGVHANVCLHGGRLRNLGQRNEDTEQHGTLAQDLLLQVQRRGRWGWVAGEDLRRGERR